MMKTTVKNKLTTEIAELYPKQGEWTEDDYFTLPDTNRIVELSDGRLSMPPLPVPKHQRIVHKLVKKFDRFIEANELGEIYFAPLPVRLWQDKIREPDIFFIAKEHLDRVKEKYCEVPDLVVEVVSRATERVDRIEKFNEYERAGVREYWICDADNETIEIYVLKKGKYKLKAKCKKGDVAQSEILDGLEIALDEIF